MLIGASADPVAAYPVKTRNPHEGHRYRLRRIAPGLTVLFVVAGAATRARLYSAVDAATVLSGARAFTWPASTIRRLTRARARIEAFWTASANTTVIGRGRVHHRQAVYVLGVARDRRTSSAASLRATLVGTTKKLRLCCDRAKLDWSALLPIIANYQNLKSFSTKISTTGTSTRSLDTIARPAEWI